MGVGAGGDPAGEPGDDAPASPRDDEPSPRPRDDEPSPRPRDNLLGVRNRAIVGVVFAALYIATFGPRTGWAAAIVSGLLGGIVLFLLLREVDARRRRKRR